MSLSLPDEPFAFRRDEDVEPDEAPPCDRLIRGLWCIRDMGHDGECRNGMERVYTFGA